VTLRVTLAALVAAALIGGGNRAAVLAIADRRAEPLPLCGDPAGDADRRDRAADHHLGAPAVSGIAGLRLDRRVLPDRPRTRRSASTAADRNLLALFRLYGASPAQTLLYLRLPTALPYFMAGLRISGGLALIGAVVAEFVAGTGGAETGLAFRILEAGYRLAIPRLFAALFLLSLTGIVIYLLLDSCRGGCCVTGTRAPPARRKSKAALSVANWLGPMTQALAPKAAASSLGHSPNWRDWWYQCRCDGPFPVASFIMGVALLLSVLGLFSDAQAAPRRPGPPWRTGRFPAAGRGSARAGCQCG